MSVYISFYILYVLTLICGSVPLPNGFFFKFRKELKEKYSSQGKAKVEKDYERMKMDFYRMELHRLKDVHPVNRDNMRAAYLAYLQNTPGSSKAVKECMKELADESEQKDTESEQKDTDQEKQESANEDDNNNEQQEKEQQPEQDDQPEEVAE